MKLKCSNCGRLFADVQTMNGAIKCNRCKTMNKFDLITQSYYLNKKQEKVTNPLTAIKK